MEISTLPLDKPAKKILKLIDQQLSDVMLLDTLQHIDSPNPTPGSDLGSERATYHQHRTPTRPTTTPTSD
ncbi:hypothetical protein [uncultured Microbulbifer sp.]|uniref:hypothetical protein n=1 Tax=uncultured Microbulbifer sp. TaxID=348147 RepID=UPI0026171161|nr:hypothetical protein [uncultured Microbulbifer sp.]